MTAAAELTPATRLGVYVHWPYCARLCPYCDFNVYRDRGVDPALWTRALRADLARWAARTPGRRLSSLYFGGGTPSLAPLAVIRSVVEACTALWGFEAGAEITLEANPGSAEAARFRDFAAVGVNRLSLGVQALDEDALAFLGRDHTAAEARGAIDLALTLFERTTFDLIYARPGQTRDAWRRELGGALALGATHLSLYQLTIEAGTAFDRQVARGRWAPPEETLAADLFDIASETTAAAGLPAYEVSNHARPGDESRHNLLYWTYQDYLGVGPGAHGRLTESGARLAFETARRPEAYLAAALGDGETCTEERLSAEAAEAERLTLGLRLSAGVALDDEAYAALGPRAAPLVDAGFLIRDGGALRATPAGRRVLDAVLRALLA